MCFLKSPIVTKRLRFLILTFDKVSLSELRKKLPNLYFMGRTFLKLLIHFEQCLTEQQTLFFLFCLKFISHSGLLTFFGSKILTYLSCFRNSNYHLILWCLCVFLKWLPFVNKSKLNFTIFSQQNHKKKNVKFRGVQILEQLF